MDLESITRVKANLLLLLMTLLVMLTQVLRLTLYFLISLKSLIRFHTNAYW